MTVLLGIDAGGTYTDAVLVDQAGRTVLVGAKALTTHHDLSLGIGESLKAVFEGASLSATDVSLVGLSTTLATNAIVEGRGGSVCLMLIGYDLDLIRQYGFERELVTRDVVYLQGGHDGEGNEVGPLEEEAAREAILARRGRVEAFAVSGYFGVRNPAHELRVRALVEELAVLPDGQTIPVTCGHELTTRLNAVRRATTTALNASLIPLLRELIATVRGTLDGLGIAAPLMVVKGDGSLVRAQWAMQRPVETILSGPAASVVGAWHLAGRRDAWVVDVGGTTTDIAALHEGRPRLNPHGAQVGRWRTMVEAVDVHTVGLGGDSLVRLDGDGRLTIGPRRVVPLCMLASECPEVVEELRRQRGEHVYQAGHFLRRQRQVAAALAPEAQVLLEYLAAGPRPLSALLQVEPYTFLLHRRVEQLESRQLVQRSAFTPTDALHVLGRFTRWDTTAARLGAEILAAQAGLSPEALCERVVAGVGDRVSTELVNKVLSDETAPGRAVSLSSGSVPGDGPVLPDWRQERWGAALLDRALGNVRHSDLDCRLTLQQPLVAVGAPVEAYLPQVSRQLHTELIIPAHADVGNAVGAVAGGVFLQQRVLIQPLAGDTGLRLHLPDGVQDWTDLEEAVAHAQAVVSAQLRARARQAGAEQVEIQVDRVDKKAPVKGGWEHEIYLGTELTFRAVGRPSPADHEG